MFFFGMLALVLNQEPGELESPSDASCLAVERCEIAVEVSSVKIGSDAADSARLARLDILTALRSDPMLVIEDDAPAHIQIEFSPLPGDFPGWSLRFTLEQNGTKRDFGPYICDETELVETTTDKLTEVLEEVPPPLIEPEPPRPEPPAPVAERTRRSEPPPKLVDHEVGLAGVSLLGAGSFLSLAGASLLIGGMFADEESEPSFTSGGSAVLAVGGASLLAGAVLTALQATRNRRRSRRQVSLSGSGVQVRF